MAAISTLIDGFDTKDTSKWNWGSGPTQFTGTVESVMIFPAIDYGANGANYAIGNGSWDFNNSTIYWDVYQLPVASPPANSTTLDLGFTTSSVIGGNLLHFRVVSTGTGVPKLEGHWSVGGVDHVVSADLMGGEAIPRYLRLRSDNSNVYFETGVGSGPTVWTIRYTLSRSVYTQGLSAVAPFMRTDGSAADTPAQLGGVNRMGKTTVVPSAPTAFTVTPGDAHVLVTWGPPVIGLPITSYTLVFLRDGNLGAGAYGIPSSWTSYDMKNLANGVTYVVNLYAVNEIGVGAAAAAAATPFTILTTPGPVTSLAAMAASDDSALVTWTPPVTGTTPTGYRITSTPDAGIRRTSSTELIFRGLLPDTLYTFTVVPEVKGVPGVQTTSNPVRTLAKYPGLPPQPPPPLPNFYAFPQPLDPGDLRVFRPGNFGKTLDQVPKGE